MPTKKDAKEVKPTTNLQPETKNPEVAQLIAKTTTEPAPSKQQLILANLKAAWEARNVDLAKLEVIPDGKFLMVMVGPNWPLVKIGPTGGIDLPQIRSYAKAFDAAVNGDVLLKKQSDRMAKKAATSTATSTAPVAEKKEEPKADTPKATEQKRSKSA